ncbi:hypothetical protein DsansV1_C31g0217321 [Dioscorea sansibarensis]
MDLGSVIMTVVAVGGAIVIAKEAIKKTHIWWQERQLDRKIRQKLPPGDMGWPIIGNMWTFLRSFKSRDPDSFIGSFVYSIWHFQKQDWICLHQFLVSFVCLCFRSFILFFSCYINTLLVLSLVVFFLLLHHMKKNQVIVFFIFVCLFLCFVYDSLVFKNLLK